jgi:Spy/CpxP family protein refolding chaperone
MPGVLTLRNATLEKTMNHKKPALLAILLLTGLLSAMAALAQAERSDRFWRHGPPDAEQQLAHLDRALGLTDEQSLQLLEVLQGAEAERAVLHDRVMESLGPEICALQQSTEAEILAILTPEQAESFAQMRLDRPGRHKGRHAGRHGGPALDCPQDG